MSLFNSLKSIVCKSRTSPRKKSIHNGTAVSAMVETLEKRELKTAAIGLVASPGTVVQTPNHRSETNGPANSPNPLLVANDQSQQSISSFHHGNAPTGTPGATSFSFTAKAVSTTQVTLSWNRLSGASAYIIDLWQDGAWKQLGSVGAGTSAVSVTGLSAGTTYYFDVGAYNGSRTIWANYQSVTTQMGRIDHPASKVAYTPVSGSLFGSKGPQFTDVHQGEVGDCWLMSSLAAVAARYPGDITSMFTSAGTTIEDGKTVGLYKVRFFDNNGQAQYVTVDTELPAGGGYYDRVSNGVLWVALAEKAYAQANGMGYVTTGAMGQDSYSALNEGWPSWALHAITGQSADEYNINPKDIAAAWKSGYVICLGSSPNANDYLIDGDSQGTHAYAVVGYNASSSSPFELYNPWGLSSKVNGTISMNGHTLYGGAFFANASLIANDFDAESFCGQAMFDSIHVGKVGRQNSLNVSHTDWSNFVSVTMPLDSAAVPDANGFDHQHGSFPSATAKPASQPHQSFLSATDHFFAGSIQDLHGFTFDLEKRSLSV